MARRGRPKGSKKASTGAKAALSTATRASEASSMPRRSPRKLDEAANAVAVGSSVVTVVEPSADAVAVVSKQSTSSSAGKKSCPASSHGKSASTPQKPGPEVEVNVGEEVESVEELTAPPVPSSRKLKYDEDDEMEEAEQAAASDANPPQKSQRDENDETEEAGEEVAASEDSPEPSEFEPSANESATQDVESEDGESGSVQIAAAATLPDGIKPRRRTMFWSEEEEECLRNGVEMYGLGKWRTILDAGAGIFSKHRTNVDLKDKWKNLQLGKEKRKRGSPKSPRPDSEPAAASVTFGATLRRKKQRTAAAVATASFAAVRNAEGSQSPNEPRHHSQSKASVPARAHLMGDNYYEIDDDDEDEEEEQRKQQKVKQDAESAAGESVQVSPKANDQDFVKLKFVTDQSYPRCKKVATLKEFVRKYIVFDAPTATDLQLVGIQSRRLIDDHEDLKSCVERFGNYYYVVC
ncbi:Telomeric repeat binding protein, partial [Globisporangium splendens]